MNARIFLLCALMLPPVPAHAQDAPHAESVEQLALAIEEIPPSSETCGVATPLLRDLTSRTDFASAVHPRRQALLLTRLAMCTGDESKFDEALAYAERAAVADPESWTAQAIRMQLGMVAGKPLSSVEAFDALSRLRPEAIRNIDGFRIGQLTDAANRIDPSGESALKVYEAMLRAAWKPAAPDFDDRMRVEHAQLLIERNRLDEARKRLETVTDVSSLVVMRADRRFDPLRQDPSFEAQLELGAGAERNVARAQAAMDANPRLVQAAVQYADALVAANRHADSLASARTTLQRLDENPGLFDDAEMGKSMTTAMVGSSLCARPVRRGASCLRRAHQGA